MHGLLLWLALIAVVSGACPTEVNTSAALCDAITAASDTCGVLYTGTEDRQIPSSVSCLIQRSINITCSSAAPAFKCRTVYPCFHVKSDEFTPTVTVIVQGCTLMGIGFASKKGGANITLRGVMLDGMGSFLPFAVEGADSVTLEDSVVINGSSKVAPGGGCVSITSRSIVALRRLNIRNCRASGLEGSGGAVFVNATVGVVVLEDVSVTDGTLTALTGAGACVSLHGVKVTLERVDLKRCDASGRPSSGCLHISGNVPNSSATITDSVFSDCRSETHSGGIRVNDVAVIVVESVTIRNATAVTGNNGCLNINANNVPNSSATITNSMFSDCRAQKSTGGIGLFYVGVVVVSNITIRNATAVTGEGGCMYIDGQAVELNSTATIANSVFHETLGAFTRIASSWSWYRT